MSRHARRSFPVRWVAAVAAVAVPVAAWAAFNLFPSQLTGGAAATCRALPLRIAAAPTIAASLREALRPVQGTALAGGSCLAVTVDPVAASTIVASLGSRTVAGASPELWVPESSLSLGQAAPSATVILSPSLARSPVVLVTSTDAARELGWPPQRPPRWIDALTGGHPVAGDFFEDAAAQGAVFALLATAKDEAAFRGSLAGLSLSVYAPMPGDPSSATLLAEGSAATPLIPVSEQSALDRRRSGGDTFAVVYPREGSPVLDYPLVRLPAARPVVPGTAADLEAAVSMVAGALDARSARDAFRAAGFRTADAVPGAVAPEHRVVEELDLPSADVAAQVRRALQATSSPVRLLAVLDVSLSMRAQVAPGVRRVDVLREAAVGALSRLNGNQQIGAWEFAARLRGSRDWQPLADIRPLGASDGSSTHREVMIGRLRSIADDLRPGGTGLYDTVDAAVGEMRRTYDPQAENIVVVFTDGANDDRGGLTVQEATSRLKAGSRASDVRLIMIGVGPDVDAGAMKRLAEATPGGASYVVTDPKQLAPVLLDVLTRRL